MTKRSKRKAPVRAPLTELESDVMKAVWSGSRSSVEDVHRIVARKYDLKETTVRTLLRRLEHKGYLEHEADVIFRLRLGDLFAKETDPIRLIKHKKFLEGLENAVDHCASVGSSMEAILIKNG